MNASNQPSMGSADAQAELKRITELRKEIERKLARVQERSKRSRDGAEGGGQSSDPQKSEPKRPKPLDVEAASQAPPEDTSPRATSDAAVVRADHQVAATGTAEEALPVGPGPVEAEEEGGVYMKSEIAELYVTALSQAHAQIENKRKAKEALRFARPSTPPMPPSSAEFVFRAPALTNSNPGSASFNPPRGLQANGSQHRKLVLNVPQTMDAGASARPVSNPAVPAPISVRPSKPIPNASPFARPAGPSSASPVSMSLLPAPTAAFARPPQPAQRRTTTPSPPPELPDFKPPASATAPADDAQGQLPPAPVVIPTFGKAMVAPKALEGPPSGVQAGMAGGGRLDPSAPVFHPTTPPFSPPPSHPLLPVPPESPMGSITISFNQDDGEVSQRVVTLTKKKRKKMKKHSPSSTHEPGGPAEPLPPSVPTLPAPPRPSKGDGAPSFNTSLQRSGGAPPGGEATLRTRLPDGPLLPAAQPAPMAHAETIRTMKLSSAVAPPLLYPGGVRTMLDSGPCHVAGKRVTEYMELYRADLRGDIRTAVERFVREPCIGRWGLRPYMRLQSGLFSGEATKGSEPKAGASTVVKNARNGNSSSQTKAQSAPSSTRRAASPGTGGTAASGGAWDPQRILCPYDLHGKCNDEECPHQHLSRPSTASKPSPSVAPSPYKPLERLPPFTLSFLSSRRAPSVTHPYPPTPSAPQAQAQASSLQSPPDQGYLALGDGSSQATGSGGAGEGDDEDDASRYFIPDGPFSSAPLPSSLSSSMASSPYAHTPAAELEDVVAQAPQDEEAWIALAIRALATGLQQGRKDDTMGPSSSTTQLAAVLLLKSSPPLTSASVAQLLQATPSLLRDCEAGASSPLRPCIRILARSLDHNPTSLVLWRMYLHHYLLLPTPPPSTKLSTLRSALQQLSPPSLPLYVLCEAMTRQLSPDFISLTSSYHAMINEAAASAHAAPVVAFLVLQRSQVLLNSGHVMAAAAWLAQALDLDALDMAGSVEEEDEHGPLPRAQGDSSPWACLSQTPSRALLVWIAHLSLSTLGDLPPTLTYLAASEDDGWGSEVWSLALDTGRLSNLRAMLQADADRRSHLAASVEALELWLGALWEGDQEGCHSSLSLVMDWNLELLKYCLDTLSAPSLPNPLAHLPSYYRFLSEPRLFSTLALYYEQQTPGEQQQLEEATAAKLATAPACDARKAAKALLQLRSWARDRAAPVEVGEGPGFASFGSQLFLTMWRDALRAWDVAPDQPHLHAGRRAEALSLEEDLMDEAEGLVGRAKEGSRDVVLRLLMLWQIRWGLGGTEAALPSIRYWLRQPRIRRLGTLDRALLHLEHTLLCLHDPTTLAEVLSSSLRDLTCPATLPTSTLGATILHTLHTEPLQASYRAALCEAFLSSLLTLLPAQDACQLSHTLLEHSTLWAGLPPLACHRLLLPLSRAILPLATGRPSHATELLHLRGSLRARLRALEDLHPASQPHAKPCVPWVANLEGGSSPSPFFAPLAHSLAMCEVALQEYARAQQALERGLKLEPLAWPLWLALARLDAGFSVDERAEQVGGALSYHPVRLPLILRGDSSLAWSGACRMRVAARQGPRSVALAGTSARAVEPSNSSGTLDLSHALTSPIIPRSLFCLHSGLTALSLASNELSILPPSFTRLSALRSLDLASNAFAVVPVPALRLPSLRVLSLAGNRLASLPSDWGVLRLHLEVLDLCRNTGSAQWSGETVRKKFQRLKVLKLT